MNAFSVRRGPAAVRVGAPLAAVALVAAGCGTQPAASGSGATTNPASSTTTAIVQTRTGPDGRYLTDGSGRALYLWTADSGTTSSCNGACAAVWPPLTTSGTPQAAAGAQSADLGMTQRADGSEQVTYAGHPLYYFAQDSGPGQTTGEASTGFGAAWWLVSPTGTAITTGGTPTEPGTSPTPGSSSSDSGSAGSGSAGSGSAGSGYGGYG